METQQQPIGVFDSGVGGLTLVRALRELMPQESMLYLGDTARLPYGTKTRETVERYAIQACNYLVERGIKMLVVACHTACALALPAIEAHFGARVPVIGVLFPGIRAACHATKTKGIAVIATEGTIASGAYHHAMHHLDPAVTVIEQACPLLVALAEEGWLSGDLVQAIIAKQLEPIWSHTEASRLDSLILGCTHFPILRDAIAAVIPPSVHLIDPALETAKEVRELLIKHQLAHQGEAQLTFLATDGPKRFTRVAETFLQAAIMPGALEVVSL